MSAEHAARFTSREAEARALLTASPPGSYDDLVRLVASMLHDEDDYQTPDPERVTAIDHGDYQGTRVYVIAADGYQPRLHWYARVSYGSCSGCDFFQSAREDLAYDGDGEPIYGTFSPEAIASLLTWCREFAARMEPMIDGEVRR